MGPLAASLGTVILVALTATCAGCMLIVMGVVLNYLYVDYIRWDTRRLRTKAERAYDEAEMNARFRQYLEALRRSR